MCKYLVLWYGITGRTGRKLTQGILGWEYDVMMGNLGNGFILGIYHIISYLLYYIVKLLKIYKYASFSVLRSAHWDNRELGRFLEGLC